MRKFGALFAPPLACTTIGGSSFARGKSGTALTRCWSVPGDCHLFMFAIVGEEGRRLFSACLLVDLTGGWENEGVGGGGEGGGGD